MEYRGEEKSKWGIARLVIGILSILLSVLVTVQSCAAGIGNALADNGEVGGAAGWLLAVFFLVTGIIGIAARNSTKKGAAITCCVLLWIGFFLSRIMAGSYTDLFIWGFVAFAFGCVYLFSGMRTKKSLLICAIVAAVFFALMLAAGGSSDAEPAAAAEDAAPKAAEAGPAAAAVDAAPKAAEVKPAAAEQEPPAFVEQTIVDNEECIVKVTGIDEDGLWGYTLQTYLENKSADKTYMFSVTGAAINGATCKPLFAQEVAAGKKANTEISLPKSTLEENGITDFTDIQLAFRVYHTDDWAADAVAELTAHIYPRGEAAAERFTRTPQSSDLVLFDNEFAEVVVIGYKKDAIWGYAVKLFLVNRTDSEIMFSIEESSVNGFMADPFWAASVGPGNCAFESVTWSENSLKEIGVTEIDEIEFRFRAYDNEDWLADPYIEEVVQLSDPQF